MTFKEWLPSCKKQRGTGLLSPKSVDHYYQGFNTVDEEALKNGNITKSMKNMTLTELDLAILVIMSSDWFKIKDNVGDKMYSNSLKKYRLFVYLNSDAGKEELAAENELIKDKTITSTEKERLIKSRVGQGIYREKLMKKYIGKCIMTQTSLSQTLIASHIKPWSVCNNDERLSVDNGLLLSATYDRLFDSGLITFTDEGVLKVSSMIDEQNRKLLKLVPKKKYDIKYNSNMHEFLEYHRNVIFIM